MYHPPKPLPTLEEFLALFDESVHGQIREALELPGTDGVACMTVLDMSSSSLGMRTALVFGPERSCKTEELPNRHLGDVPSRFQYPEFCWFKPGCEQQWLTAQEQFAQEQEAQRAQKLS